MARTPLNLQRPDNGRRPAPQVRPEQATWYRIENSASATSVYVYDEIGVWGVTAGDFIAALSGLDAFDLHINSPGGDVFDGVAIYNALLAHPGDVTGYVDGLAASAASFIAMACTNLKVAKTAQMMIHDASGLVWGNAADMHAMASLLDKASDNIAGIYADKSGLPAEQWREAMRAETWYSGDEAVAAGLADEVFVPAKGRKDAPSATWDLSIFNFAGRDKAPAPKTPAPTPVVTPPAPLWDVAAIRTSLKEAVR